DSHAHVEIDEPPALLVVGHGSRDADGVEEFWALSRAIREVAGELPVDFGFIEMAEPVADVAIDRLVESGQSDIVSVPLVLLAAGVLVPRIYRQAQDWAAEHPEVDVRAAAHLGPDPRLARLVLERHREAVFGDVRMNCDLCTYRVRLPSYEDKVGMPISLTPHGDAPARGKRRTRRATRAPLAPI